MRRSAIPWAATSAYGLLVFALIWLGSTRDYEFMLGELDDGHPITVCDLPPSADDAWSVYAPVCGILVLIPVAVGSVRLFRAGRFNFQLGTGFLLATAWAYRFFLRTAGC